MYFPVKGISFGVKSNHMMHELLTFVQRSHPQCFTPGGEFTHMPYDHSIIKHAF